MFALAGFAFASCNGDYDDWSKQRKDEYKLVNGGGDPYADPVFSVTIPSPGDVTVEL